MPIYQKCSEVDPDVERLAKVVLKSYKEHTLLVEQNVKIDFLFALPSGDATCALKLHGVPTSAIAKPVSYEHRVKGEGDAQVTIDKDWWDNAVQKQRIALLDHELYHFELRFGEKGLKRDDLGRPKVFTRHHDYDLGLFRHIAKRHGVYSAECERMAGVMLESGQLFWPSIITDQTEDATEISFPGATPVTLTTEEFAALLRGKCSPDGDDALTISAPGMESLTLTTGQLSAVAEKVAAAL